MEGRSWGLERRRAANGCDSKGKSVSCSLRFSCNRDLTMQERLMTIDIQQAIEAGNRLRNHPYTLLHLSDREKFHTGFLAFCLKRYKPTFFYSMFGRRDPLPDLLVDVEYQSMDIVVRESKDPKIYLAAAEVKLKTDLHDDQVRKYRKKIGKHAVARVIGLFPPTEANEQELKQRGFPYEGLTEKIPGWVEEQIRGESDPEIKCIFTLWVGYLRDLGVLRSYFVEKGTESIGQDIVDALDDIKLKGIFERYRHGLITSQLQDLRFREELGKDGEGKGPLDIGNSHGNGILDLYTIPRPKKKGEGVQMGLQWQAGQLKLFVHHKKDSESRNKLLKGIAEKIKSSGKLDFEVKPNKEGRFRSVTLIDKGWDILKDDISDKHQTLREVYEMLDEFIDEARRLR